MRLTKRECESKNGVISEGFCLPKSDMALHTEPCDNTCFQNDRLCYNNGCHVVCEQGQLGCIEMDDLMFLQPETCMASFQCPRQSDICYEGKCVERPSNDLDEEGNMLCTNFNGSLDACHLSDEISGCHEGICRPICGHDLDCLWGETCERLNDDFSVCLAKKLHFENEEKHADDSGAVDVVFQSIGLGLENIEPLEEEPTLPNLAEQNVTDSIQPKVAESDRESTKSVQLKEESTAPKMEKKSNHDDHLVNPYYHNYYNPNNFSNNRQPSQATIYQPTDNSNVLLISVICLSVVFALAIIAVIIFFVFLRRKKKKTPSYETFHSANISSPFQAYNTTVPADNPPEYSACNAIPQEPFRDIKE